MAMIFNPLDLLKFCLNVKYDSEKKFLEDLQENISKWYNTIAIPLIPILEINSASELNPKTITEIRNSAKKIFQESILHNEGNEIKNLLDVLPAKGIFYIKDNAKLRNKIYALLQSGDFVKKIVFLPDINNFDNANDFEKYINNVKCNFYIFKERKEKLEELICKRKKWLL